MLIMIFWFVCMLIRLIVSEHVLNSFDLTCKKRLLNNYLINLVAYENLRP